MKKVKYKCNHVSCRMDCYRGTIKIKDEKFKVLRDVERDPNKFRVSAAFCKIGSDCSATIESIDGIGLFTQEDVDLMNKINRKQQQLSNLKREYKLREKTLKEEIKLLKEEVRSRQPEKKKQTKKEQKPKENPMANFSFLVEGSEGEEK